MMFLGLLADICIRIYFETQKRAHYNVREVVTSASGVRWDGVWASMSLVEKNEYFAQACLSFPALKILNGKHI